MSGNQMLLLAGAKRAAVDPYFYSVTTLLHGDGTNAAQNNTFLDSSSNNFTITRNGNTTQGSFSPFSQTGWSNYFDGTGDYLSLSYNSAFDITSGDFTVELWVYRTVGSVEQYLFSQRQDSPSRGWEFRLNNTNVAQFFFVGGSSITGSGTIPTNAWTHLAVTRSSNTVRLFINGTQDASATFANGTATTSALYLGYGTTGGGLLTGYISNARIVKGTAVYTAAFTPPTKPLTAISGTSLLTCQANRFLDASTNAFAITRNGDVSVQPFSPFNPTSAYSTSSVGGSGYFDGSGDYLTATNDTAINPGTGDFTLECWVYATGAVTNDSVFEGSQNGLVLAFNASSQLAVAQSNVAYIVNDTVAFTLNEWVHVAVVRSGTTLSLFKNGSRVATATNSTNFVTSTENRIGRSAGTDYFTGYISNLRFVKGTAVYSPSSTTLTVPTAPVTAISGTGLLLNFTNGAIFDNAAVADYETVGNAQISTSVKKYGTGSIYLDGTGDYLDSPPSRNFDFDAGDFTIEAWIYTTSLATEQGICANQDNGTNTTLDGWVFNVGTTGALAFLDYTNASAAFSVVSSASAIAINTWYHVAVCRVAGTVKLYINGTAVATGTRTASIPVSTSNQPFRVGNWRYATDTNREFTGYIDDVRISKGIGRYPYNFTPPTAEFPNIGGTPPALTFDPYYDYTTLLLPGNGTNGAQNNTFLDSSTNAFTITRNGNTTQGTFSPFSQTGWANYFDGSSGYLRNTSTSISDFGTGNFTAEVFVYKVTSAAGFVYDGRSTSGNGPNFQIYFDSNNKVITVFNGAVVFTSTIAVPLNQWTHVVICRGGTGSNQGAVFINGTRSDLVTLSGTYTNGDNIIGAAAYTPLGAAVFPGYISNFRIVKGTDVYGYTNSTITVPTAPLTAISGTSLLTCQSNRFQDASSNNYALTVSGSPSVQTFSPFNPTAAWSAATNGGSGYFDGSGDYLSVADNTALDISGQFTWECWVYFSSISGSSDNILYSKLIVTPSVTGLEIGVNTTGKFYVWINGSVVITSTSSVSAGQWVHLAASRDGSNNVRIFINGTSAATAVSNSADTSTSASVILGANYAGSARVTGYISNFRLVKGTAVYTANFTPPTAPLTAVSGTSLLLNFTNAGIYDATSKNDLETVGNAQISTTQSKFGGSSMYFDGTGDYLFRNGASDLFVINSDYTVECWVYFNSTSGTQILVSYGTLPWYLCIGDITAGKAQFTWSSSAPTNYHATGTTTLSTGTWYHIAGVRYGSNIYLYVNGIQEAVTAISGLPRSPSTNALAIGAMASGSSTANAYIQDLRITKGIARYTSNFTPPSTAFLTL